MDPDIGDPVAVTEQIERWALSFIQDVESFLVKERSGLRPAPTQLLVISSERKMPDRGRAFLQREISGVSTY